MAEQSLRELEDQLAKLLLAKNDAEATATNILDKASAKLKEANDRLATVTQAYEQAKKEHDAALIKLKQSEQSKSTAIIERMFAGTEVMRAEQISLLTADEEVKGRQKIEALRTKIQVEKMKVMWGNWTSSERFTKWIQGEIEDPILFFDDAALEQLQSAITEHRCSFTAPSKDLLAKINADLLFGAIKVPTESRFWSEMCVLKEVPSTPKNRRSTRVPFTPPSTNSTALCTPSTVTPGKRGRGNYAGEEDSSNEGAMHRRMAARGSSGKKRRFH